MRHVEVTRGAGASRKIPGQGCDEAVRKLHYLLGALLVIIALSLAAVAFVLYDPLSGGRHFLAYSDMITAPPGATSSPGSDPEAPIQQTDSPAMAALALHYQPTLVVSGFDRMWPVSLVILLRARWRGQAACIYIGGQCRLRNPSVSALTAPGAFSDYIRFAPPVDNVEDTFVSTAHDLGLSAAALRGWPRHLADIDPFASAQIYFYYLGRTRRRSYPGVPAGLISLEYWFYYPLNYFPLVRIPLEALSNPLGSTIGNTDYHQGDFEHVAVLLDPKTLKPRYLWMARHADEGQVYRWHSRAVQWQGNHATIYAALGSHASYARCGIQRRSRTYRFINDYVVCIPHETYAFTYASTRLVDLAQTSWGCWRGHLGEAGRHLRKGRFGFAPFETSGPVSPLLQQENFGVACRVPPRTSKPAPQL